jgi:hypothetical protein
MTNRVALLIFGVWITLQCQGAHASTLAKEDDEEFERLTMQAGQLALDIVTAEKEAPLNTRECLSRIYYNLSTAHSNIEETYTLVAISTSMKAPSDEAFVNMMLLAHIHNFQQALLILLYYIREAANTCLSDKIVNEKARLAQDLLSEAARSTELLQNKLKAAQK